MSRILDSFGRPYNGTNGTLPNIPGGEAGSRAIRQGAYDDFALPKILQFQSVFETGYRSFWHGAGDEAVKFDRETALAMRRDSGLMGAVNERRLAFTSLNWHLEIPDERDRVQVRVRDTLTTAVRGIPGFHRIVWALSDAIWYGRSAVQVLWRWKQVGGFKVLVPRKFSPVNGDKISYLFDGTPCIAVFGAVTSDSKVGEEAALTPAEQDAWARQNSNPYSLANAHFVWTQYGKALVLDGSWRERFIISQHELDDRDFQNGEEAEAIHGRGIRDVLFALDWMRREWLAQISDYFERVGQGITLWYWDASNPASKAEVESAARDQSDRVNLLVPRWPDGKGNNKPGVERIEVPTAGSEFLLKLVEMIDRYQERYINGQTLSHETEGSGLGGTGVAAFHASTKIKIAAQDSLNCAQALTGDPENPGLLSMMKDWSFPDFTYDFPVTFKFDLEREESKEKLDAAKTIVEMGIPTKADELRAVAGLSKPTDGDELVGGAPAGAGGNMFSRDPGKLFASSEEPDQLRQHARDASGHDHNQVGQFTGPGNSGGASASTDSPDIRDPNKAYLTSHWRQVQQEAETYPHMQISFDRPKEEDFQAPDRIALDNKVAKLLGKHKDGHVSAYYIGASGETGFVTGDGTFAPFVVAETSDGSLCVQETSSVGGDKRKRLKITPDNAKEVEKFITGLWRDIGFYAREGEVERYARDASGHDAFDGVAARYGASKALALLAHAIKAKQLPLEGSSAGAKLRPLEGSAAFAEMPLTTLLQLQRELGLSGTAGKREIPGVRDLPLRQYMREAEAAQQAREAEGIGFAAGLEAASAMAAQQVD